MNHSINKHAQVFGFISVFLTGLGLTIVAPVLPFLVASYTKNETTQAFIVTALTSLYAFAIFLASPILGSLSDRFGRRPILLLSLVGSAIGYSILGIGGSIGVLFLGRIIEGLTGGEISALFAYFSDITSEAERTKYFGWLSALVGVGTALGPIIGGTLAEFDIRLPMYAGAFITLLNTLYGYFFMPESLDISLRAKSLSLKRLNPFIQLKEIFSIRSVSYLLLTGFLLWLSNGSLQAIFSQFSIDTFHWQPLLIGLTFSIIGALDIFSQLIIMPRLLLVFTDSQIAQLGIGSEIVGYLFIASSSFTELPALFILGMIFFGVGDAIFGPSFNGKLSKSVAPHEQGHVQGGAQSIQALARVIGPLIGGQLYVSINHSMPAFMGILFLIAAFIVLRKSSNHM